MVDEPPAKPRQGLLSSLPNQLTTLRLVLAGGLAAAIAGQAWVVALILFALAAITDWLDGLAARRLAVVSSFGRAYDPLADKVLTSVAFVFLMTEPRSGLAAWMVATIIAREFIVTGIRGYLEEIGVPFGADMLGKVKMVLQCVALVWIFIALGEVLAPVESTWVIMVRDILNYAAVGMTIASGVNYIRRAGPHLV